MRGRRLDIAIAAFCGIASITLAAVFGENPGAFSSFDSASLALAAEDFSIAEVRPHFPGYYFYVKAIEFVDLFTRDSGASLLVLSALFTGFGSFFLYFILRKIVDIQYAAALAALAIFNPFLIYFSTVSETYAFDYFFSTALVFLLFDNKLIFLSPIVLALGAGFRQSSAFFLFPVYMWFWIAFISKKRARPLLALGSHFLAIILVALWLFPSAASLGGVTEYFRAPFVDSPFVKLGVAKNLVSFLSYVLPVSAVCVIIAAASIFAYIGKKPRFDSFEKKIFRIAALWILPAIVFFVFVHYNKGYFLICYPAVFLAIAACARRGLIGKGIISALVVFSAAVFLFRPYVKPKTQIYFSSDERGISKLESAWERLNSFYSLGLKKIESQSRFYQSFDESLRILKSRGETSDGVLFEPSCGMKPRRLQPGRGDIVLYEIDRQNFNGFNVYRGLDYRSEIGLDSILRSVVIVSSREFFDRYVSAGEPILLTNESAYYRVESPRELFEVFVEKYCPRKP